MISTRSGSSSTRSNVNIRSHDLKVWIFVVSSVYLQVSDMLHQYNRCETGRSSTSSYIISISTFRISCCWSILLYSRRTIGVAYRRNTRLFCWIAVSPARVGPIIAIFDIYSIAIMQYLPKAVGSRSRWTILAVTSPISFLDKRNILVSLTSSPCCIIDVKNIEGYVVLFSCLVVNLAVLPIG